MTFMIFGTKHTDKTNSNSPLGAGGHVNLTVPSNYSEMTGKQIRYVAALNMYGMSEKDIWTRCLIKFSGIKPIVGYREKYIFAKKGLKGFFYWNIEEMSYFVKKCGG